MIVTRFNYPLEKNLLKKIDLMIKRCTTKNPKRDAVLEIEGAEGEGKTTLSVAIAYYVAEKTNRKFNHTNIFFDAQKMIDFLKNTEEEVAIWDEPALSALSKDTMSKIVKNVERLLMMSRKKRHFLIINIAYFNRFNDYIVWQRPLGMIHVYSRSDIEAGRFVYIRKKYLEKLYMDWRTKKKRNYFKYAAKSIRGTFPDVLNPDYKNNVLAEFDIVYYEKAKDDAIKAVSVLEDKRDLRQIKKEWCLHVMIVLDKKGIKLKQDVLSELFQCSMRNIQHFAKEIREVATRKSQNILNNGDSQDNEMVVGEEGYDIDLYNKDKEVQNK